MITPRGAKILEELLTELEGLNFLRSEVRRSAGWKMDHHFDGMKPRKDGDFHGRTVSLPEGSIYNICKCFMMFYLYIYIFILIFMNISYI